MSVAIPKIDASSATLSELTAKSLNLEDIKLALEKEGWIVSSGMKFGADLLLNDQPTEITHSKYALFFLKGEETWRDLIAQMRLAQSVAKDLVIAFPNAAVTFEDSSHQQPFTLLILSSWDASVNPPLASSPH
ncbi:hypothetical protein IE077_002711 [Cardiosporidium cionae]|uniref:tRNA-intron lyase n=1 Tax=Cardiosporidium cionae TaxID=476202 RepID=A0ABQ7JA58_9APIC|nr:hypothetical protein IE077_002711 [Cardiosporidium cionae]|eukprot:KAF8820880.1 hypothetical protein IE077_002711 [Cardiosporidium cionae]